MENKENKKRRVIKGTIVSNKMQKTVIVSVTRLRMHPKYKKYYKITKRYKAHNENQDFQVGDKVLIQETNPISKEKTWRVKGLIEKIKFET